MKYNLSLEEFLKKYPNKNFKFIEKFIFKIQIERLFAKIAEKLGIAPEKIIENYNPMIFRNNTADDLNKTIESIKNDMDTLDKIYNDQIE